MTTGYVYLVHSPIWKDNVFKIGKTGHPMKRMGSYGSDTIIYRLVFISDMRSAEKELKQSFTKLFTLTRGAEYFKGDVDQMGMIFDCIVGKYREVGNPVCNEECEEAEIEEAEEIVDIVHIINSWIKDNLSITDKYNDYISIQPAFESFSIWLEKFHPTCSCTQKQLQKEIEHKFGRTNKHGNWHYLKLPMINNEPKCVLVGDLYDSCNTDKTKTSFGTRLHQKSYYVESLLKKIQGKVGRYVVLTKPHIAQDEIDEHILDIWDSI